ncbi:MAG TPA: peptidylprolyl isomerase [Pyrinomonadaceae bacterium]|jgi:cyclophilin family peptidyl-prolyl cis-trans isomerase/HEAT repeat protein|nr:peptidylprolyl isomerase [Pyrinomonadaceae bacterium]
MNVTLKTNSLRLLSGRRVLTVCMLLAFLATNTLAQRGNRKLQNPTSGDPVSKILLLRIVRAEDERRWDDDLRSLFTARNANVRARAALAAGRIGNEEAVADLISLLQKDDEPEVRTMAAFALGEIESPLGADALVSVLKDKRNTEVHVHARALEALGKITAAMPKENEMRAHELAAVVLDALSFENRKRSAPDDLVVLLGLTAVLRTKPANAGPVLVAFLHYSNPRIRADAANTLARLKLKDGDNELRELLMNDADPVVRANAARAVGAAETASLDGLLDRALNDKDSRVRVSALRALAAMKDHPGARSTAERLLKAQGGCAILGKELRNNSECLDLITTLGRTFQGSDSENAYTYIRQWSMDFPGNKTPESDIALVRIAAARYLREMGNEAKAKRDAQETMLTNWRAGSALAQGLGEIAALPDSTKDKNALSKRAQDILRAMLDYRNSGLVINTLVAVHSEYAIPDVLQAYSAFKTKDLAEVARKHLRETDVVVRATAAGLLGDLAPDETNTRALVAALPVALADAQLNDAALAILDSLGKQKSAKANDAIKTALNSADHLIRRKAVAVLKENGAGDFSSRIGTVQTRNTSLDYERALARIGKRFNAVVTTTRGSFTIELLPGDAPLNVDNFIQLATRGYFGGITIHRVVPNFVIQDGDPRGDGNGGPGYQIRCEINEVPYNRGAVGMALSGKDTGGSQWFVTHSPQPHLEGGYTVFGNVVSGMDVVDNIARGDVIRSISITEGPARMPKRLR